MGKLRFWMLRTGLFALALTVAAEQGHWEITQLPITNVLHPVINNGGEIVWTRSVGGIVSNRRGILSASGFAPHLANSGEVVYAEWFGGPLWDLVSTTRGRLTHGGFIDLNFSGHHDVNALGEVVYVTKDSNGFAQVYSTVRDQITFEGKDHYDPCINDRGEIIWQEYKPGLGVVVMSTTRGTLQNIHGMLMDINNWGDFCYSGDMEGPPGFHSLPHICFSNYGPIINDYSLFQWDGSLNDAGVIVWTAPVKPGSSTWHVYRAQRVLDDTTPPQIVSIVATPNVLWPPNGRLIPVRLIVSTVDDSDPSPVARIAQVSSNEPSSEAAPDWEVTAALSLNLRAERLGKGKGRTYTIVIQCEDASGNVSSASVEVAVPHDRRNDRRGPTVVRSVLPSKND